jgi:transposase InsO family protein
VDQVWATDITYIPLEKGFLYLVAIVDLFSRNVLSWKLSNSLDTEFCLEALEMALEGGRKPEIFHSDQGCQFTSSDFLARLQAEAIKISWSGRSTVTPTSWWRGCGARSNTRRSTYVPTAMAGRLKSTWPVSSRGTAM